MRASIIILAFAAINLIPGQSSAMTVKAHINPGYFWSDGITNYIYQGCNFLVEIQIENDDPFNRGTISMPLTFYATGGITKWRMIDMGGEIIPNIVMMNGFEYYPYPNPWFDILDTISLFDWDGQLADTMNFTGCGRFGIPAGEPLLTRLAIYFAVDESGTFCVDSCSIPNMDPPGRYDWLFDSPYPTFGGPYCWPVKNPPCHSNGDANNDGQVNILDVSDIVDFLYRDGPGSCPAYQADVDPDYTVNLLDVTYLINYLYKNGPPPAGC